MPREIVVEHQGRAVHTEILTTATPERVWQAWVEPDRLSEWFTDRAKGSARAGGTMTWCFDRFRAQYPYEVLVADEQRRLVLKGSPPGRPPYLLEVLIEPAADGGARLRLVNSGFSAGVPTDEEHDGVESGWRMALAILKHYVETHFGRPRAAFFAMQPAPLSYDTILEHFLEERGLSRWLTAEGGIPARAGEAYRLILRDGSPMSGRVLALTSREAALTWDEIDGVLELKAFPLGPRTRAVAARGSGWDLPAETAAEIEAMLVKAIDRLVAVLAGEGAPGDGRAAR